MSKCLVVGNHTQGLSVVRALGRIGVKVHVLYDKRICLSRFSKYTEQFHKVEKDSIRKSYTADNERLLVDRILEVIPDGEKWPVFGVSEDVINVFYRNRERLSKKALIADNDIFRVIDKYIFAKVAERAGVRSPKTHLLSDVDWDFLEGREYVAKGRLGNKFRHFNSGKGALVKSRQEFDALKKRITGAIGRDEVILQEMIQGEGNIRSACGFAVKGEIVYPFLYEKVRQTPDKFGTGCYNVSIQDEGLLELGRRLIAELDYTGVFEIEFLWDDDAEEYSVIEMNPRTWKCVGLADACGQHLCEGLFRYLEAGDVPEASQSHPAGRSWAHLLVDFVHMMRERRVDFSYDRQTVFCDWDPDDPIPFFAQIVLAPLIVMGV